MFLGHLLIIARFFEFRRIGQEGWTIFLSSDAKEHDIEITFLEWFSEETMEMKTYLKLFFIEIEDIISPSWTPFNWHHVCFSFERLSYTTRFVTDGKILLEKELSICKYEMRHMFNLILYYNQSSISMYIHPTTVIHSCFYK